MTAEESATRWTPWKPALETLADVLFPRACVVCERLLDRREQGVVCGTCWTRVPVLPSPRCERCGHPTRFEACRWCELLPPYVRAARSVSWAAGDVGLGIVHALKYGGWYRTAEAMAVRMARVEWPADVVEERAGLVPVPLSPKRLRERGYNQSAYLAQTIGALWRVPVLTSVLERRRYTQTQTQLTPSERLRNVSGAFDVPVSERARIRGAHLIVVDDVVTTAATLNACAAALCEGGARIVSFLTFGRAPALGDRW